MKKPVLNIFWIPAAVQLIACASGTSPAFLDANAAYRAAAADPKITANAPVELHEAELALSRAEKAQDEGEDREQVDHLSYLAGRRVEIAQVRADKRLAEQRTERLTAQKDTVLLDARQREVETLTRELAELKARETDRGIELTVGDVLFDVGQATLKPGAVSALSRLAAFLREHPDRAVLIEGHTDSSGTPDYNLNLSLARADSVARSLVGDGVDGTRISPRGFGESTPIASNDSAAGRLQNRRVDIVVVPAPEPVANPRVGSVR
jgi:outer membrane protein OmpA-like peptidoglycan-associated protein